MCGHDAQGGIAPQRPGCPGQRETKRPTHLVQLHLCQDVRGHSVPDSHNLWKARERGVRLQASQLTVSRQGGCAPISHCPPYSAPGAGLEQKWGRGTGSGSGLWPPNPQKGMAPQSPGCDLPAWQHKRLQREGTEVLPEETSSKSRADLQQRHFQLPHESPVRAEGHPSPWDAGPLFIPEPEPQEVPAPRKSWPWVAPLARGPSHAHGSLGAAGSREFWLLHCPPSPVGPSGRVLVAAPSPVQPPPAAFDSGQPQCNPWGRSSQTPYPWWRAAGAWGTSCSAPS